MSLIIHFFILTVDQQKRKHSHLYQAENLPPISLMEVVFRLSSNSVYIIQCSQQ